MRIAKRLLLLGVLLLALGLTAIFFDRSGYGDVESLEPTSGTGGFVIGLTTAIAGVITAVAGLITALASWVKARAGTHETLDRQKL